MGRAIESYRRILVTEGSGGSGLSLRSDDLDSVGELYSEDNFRQLVVTVEAAPAFLGGLGELEDHGECGLVGETSLGAHGAVADRCERAFDDVGCAQMLPVLGREVVEGKQRIAILGQAVDRLSVFDAPGFDEGVESDERLLLGLGHPDLLQRPLGLRLLALCRGRREKLAPPRRSQPVAESYPRSKVHRRNRDRQSASSSRCRLISPVTNI